MRGEYRKNATHIMVHIPKTGVGSAEQYLKDCAAVSVPFGAHKLTVAMILAVNRSAIIVLRDPADRVISEYQWSQLDLGKDYAHAAPRQSHVKKQDTAPQGLVWNTTRLAALLSHARTHLRPQIQKLGGTGLPDPRVTVLCTERLSTDLERLAQRLCTSTPVAGGLREKAAARGSVGNSSWTRSVPWVHRTRANGDGTHYRMTTEVRRENSALPAGAPNPWNPTRRLPRCGYGLQGRTLLSPDHHTLVSCIRAEHVLVSRLVCSLMVSLMVSRDCAYLNVRGDCSSVRRSSRSTRRIPMCTSVSVGPRLLQPKVRVEKSSCLECTHALTTHSCTVRALINSH